MRYLGPFVVHGTLRVAKHDDMHAASAAYRRLIEAVRDERIDLERAGESDDLHHDLAKVVA
jgi:hypothetical protein